MLLLFHASEESGAHFRAWSQRWSILLRECSERCSECTYYCSLRLCAIFLHASWAVETRCYFSLVSHGKTRKAFSAPREVRGDGHSNGQGDCKIPSARIPFNELNKIPNSSSNMTVEPTQICILHLFMAVKSLANKGVKDSLDTCEVVFNGPGMPATACFWEIFHRFVCLRELYCYSIQIEAKITFEWHK